MVVRAPQSQTWERHVTDLLVRGEMPPEAVHDVVDAGLAAYAIERLGQGAVHDYERLRSSRLLATVRHAAIRRATAEVVAAWRAAGIETLLLKGFYLAEFVYPDSSWRAYSDVDVALRSPERAPPERVAALAAEVAQDHGFSVVWHLGEAGSIDAFHDHEYNGHELLQLVHHGTGANVDAHRRLVHSNVNLGRQSDKGDDVTRLVWDAAESAEFDGVPVLVPAAVDSALVGLIAARSWSGDRHALRPHDLLDLEMLMRHGEFSRHELLERARELGMEATARLFLRRCDPTTGVLDLRPPGPARVFWYDALLIGERGHRGLQRASAAALAAPGRVAAVLSELPQVLRQTARVRTGQGPHWRTVASGRGAVPLDRRSWRSAQLGVRRALKLVGVRPEDQRELALACLYDAVTRRGFALARRSEAGRVWFESQGRPLPLDQLGLADDGGRRDRLPGWSVVNDPAPLSVRSPGLRLLALGWSGVLLRVRAVLLLRRIEAALRSRPFQDVRAGVLPTGPVSVVSPVPEPAEPIGRAVESAARFVPGALCVAQALAGQVMLARRGVPSTIHFGFLRSPAGAVEGHAWLEADGAVVVGNGRLENFTRTATFEA